MSQKARKQGRVSSIDIDRKLTDTANGQRFIRQHAGNVLFVRKWNKWIAWSGRLWDVSGDVQELAKKTGDAIWREVAKVSSEGYDVRDLLRHAKYAHSVRGMRAMASSAASDPSVQVECTSLDAEPMLLCLPDGTLDLAIGELRDHRRDDYITQMIRTEYDSAAECPRWIKFVNEVMDGKEDMVAYLQKAVGYSLTGETKEEALFVLYGDGANGKSTFVETISALMGSYAGVASHDLLLSKGVSHPTEIASMFGKRIVTCSETEYGRSWSEAMVKKLSSREPIAARRMYEDEWSFTPTQKIWLSTNHRPKVRGVDNGIWRRLKMIPFTVTFPPERRNKNLSAELRAELPGILAWAVRGCMNWQRDGLLDPPDVERATTDYRIAEDVVRRFVGEECIQGDDQIRTPAITMYEKFSAWCKASGEEAMTSTMFGIRMKELCETGTAGFRRKAMTTGMFYLGIAPRAASHGIAA
ncbi:MAG: DUF5906 domain-containing protein [Planctomycetia bacterium]|nr:DUF5906 domain-containing protein [Planctomycetia bacterium]